VQVAVVGVADESKLSLTSQDIVIVEDTLLSIDWNSVHSGDIDGSETLGLSLYIEGSSVASLVGLFEDDIELNYNIYPMNGENQLYSVRWFSLNPELGSDGSLLSGSVHVELLNGFSGILCYHMVGESVESNNLPHFSFVSGSSSESMNDVSVVVVPQADVPSLEVTLKNLYGFEDESTDLTITTASLNDVDGSESLTLGVRSRIGMLSLVSVNGEPLISTVDGSDQEFELYLYTPVDHPLIVENVVFSVVGEPDFSGVLYLELVAISTEASSWLNPMLIPMVGTWNINADTR
jgi:hypothetical protein